MDLEGIMLSEMSQTEKEKYHMISLICGISKTIKINEQTKPNKNKHIDIENRVVVTREEGMWQGRRGEGSAKWVKEINSMVINGNYMFGGEYTVVYTEVEI